MTSVWRTSTGTRCGEFWRDERRPELPLGAHHRGAFLLTRSTSRYCGRRRHGRGVACACARRCQEAALRAAPGFAGLKVLMAAPRTLVQTGSCTTVPRSRPLHVVVDDLSRFPLFLAPVDTTASRCSTPPARASSWAQTRSAGRAPCRECGQRNRRNVDRGPVDSQGRSASSGGPLPD